MRLCPGVLSAHLGPIWWPSLGCRIKRCSEIWGRAERVKFPLTFVVIPLVTIFIRLQGAIIGSKTANNQGWTSVDFHFIIWAVEERKRGKHLLLLEAHWFFLPDLAVTTSTSNLSLQQGLAAFLGKGARSLRHLEGIITSLLNFWVAEFPEAAVRSSAWEAAYSDRVCQSHLPRFMASLLHYRNFANWAGGVALQAELHVGQMTLGVSWIWPIGFRLPLVKAMNRLWPTWLPSLLAHSSSGLL